MQSTLQPMVSGITHASIRVTRLLLLVVAVSVASVLGGRVLTAAGVYRMHIRSLLCLLHCLQDCYLCPLSVTVYSFIDSKLVAFRGRGRCSVCAVPRRAKQPLTTDCVGRDLCQRGAVAGDGQEPGPPC